MIQLLIVLLYFSFLFILNKNYKRIFFLLFFITTYNIVYFKTYNLFRQFIVFDWYNFCFIIILLLIGGFILFYSTWYFLNEPKKILFFYFLILFIFFIFLFFSFNSIIFILLRWERIGIISYFLINWWSGRLEARVSGQQAVIYNRIGDFFIYIFIFFILNLNLNITRNSKFVIFILLLFIISIISKSSLFLFHPWLPNAIEGPTPVSSLLHSSTIVVARVFLYIRFSLIINSFTLRFIRLIRGLTILYGGICSVRQTDIKKIIAYSTTSQLGFIIIIVSFIRSYFGILFLIFHAFFKSLIFIISRLFIHESNRVQNLNKIIKFNSKISSIVFLFSVMALIGFPFISRYFSKDLMLENIWREVLNCFFIVIFFFRCCFTISYCFKLIDFKLNFLSKINSIDKIRLNISWSISLVIFLFINVFFFNFIFSHESYLNIYIKFIMVLIFFFRYIIFFYKKLFNNYLFYNSLFHRFFINLNNILLKILILLEFKWLEFRLINIKFSIYHRFKISIILVILILWVFYLI